MGINLKGLAKKNKAKHSNELNEKIVMNGIIHALTILQIQGEVKKHAKKDSNGNTIFYYGLPEWDFTD